jgi:hypothetical protein
VFKYFRVRPAPIPTIQPWNAKKSGWQIEVPGGYPTKVRKHACDPDCIGIVFQGLDERFKDISLQAQHLNLDSLCRIEDPIAQSWNQGI